MPIGPNPDVLADPLVTLVLESAPEVLDRPREPDEPSVIWVIGELRRALGLSLRDARDLALGAPVDVTVGRVSVLEPLAERLRGMDCVVTLRPAQSAQGCPLCGARGPHGCMGAPDPVVDLVLHSAPQKLDPDWPFERTRTLLDAVTELRKLFKLPFQEAMAIAKGPKPVVLATDHKSMLESKVESLQRVGCRATLRPTQ